MPQRALTADNLPQPAVVDSASNITDVDVALGSPCQAGSTVIIEMFCPPGLTELGLLPDDFQQDVAVSGVLRILRKPNVAAGEQSWPFSMNVGVNWAWRVTEFDTALDLVSPLDVTSGNASAATGLTSFSTQATGTTPRPVTVSLATHLWQRAVSRPAQTFGWSNHDINSGFTERGEQRISFSTTEIDLSWSWRFDTTTGSYECVADATSSHAMDASDTYYAMLAVYAAAEEDYPPVVGIAVG